MADEILADSFVETPTLTAGIATIPGINSITPTTTSNQVTFPEEGSNDNIDDAIIEGTNKNDLIVGGSGGETIFGKEGNDTLQAGSGGNTLYGGKDDDNCIGGDGNDKARGDSGNDAVMGNAGDDEVEGGKGNDTTFGGKGKDTCLGGDGADLVYGNEGDDKVSGGEGDDAVYGGKGNDECDGDRGNDTCIGGEGNDKASGGEGNDSLVGGVGNDSLSGGDGNDACDGGAGDDSIGGDSGDDSLMGGAGNDACDGGAGDDSLSGDSGSDSLMGGTGNDSISGGTGSDSIIAGDGNDVCLGDDGDDSIIGGGGDDSLIGGDGNDSVTAGSGNNTLEGGAGDDSLEGGDGDNSLSGGEGNDTLIGGTGNHTCTGGAGSDSFIIKNVSSGGKSVLADYTDSLDKFLLDGLSFSSLSFVQVGLNTEIRGSNSFVLAVLLNISATVLEVSDFLQMGNSTTAPITPSNTPPVLEANKSFDVAAGGEQVITLDFLRFFDKEGGVKAVTYKLTELPDPKVGQLFYNGQAITSVNFTFTQLDISLQLLTFKAAAGFTGDASFGFEVTDGETTIGGQKFALKVFNTSFDFVGNTTPQVIVGSPLGDDIKAGDGGDDIKGGLGKDKITGGLGNDKIEGGEGDDEIEGGEGKNTLTGGLGRDRFVYKKAREGVIKIEDADLITDFNPQEDTLELSTAAFGNISISSFKKLKITVNIVTIDESSNLLDFSDDDSVFDIESLKKRFKGFGRNDNKGRFCQFTDRATGKTVLVFSLGIRFEIVAVFSTKIVLDINNFLFTGPVLSIPTGTDGADLVDFSGYPAPVTYDGLGGNDTIKGSKFDDELIGGDGDDAIAGAGGKDLLKGSAGADIFSYTSTKEGGDKIVDFTSGTDKFQFVSSTFGNLNSSNFDLVNITSSTTDITGKELLIFSGTYASLAAVQTKFASLSGAGTNPVFSLFQNAAGEGVLVFDVDGIGPAPAVEIANLGTGVTSLGTGDFLFNGTIAPPPPPPVATNSIVDLTAAGNTYPSGANNFGSGVGGYGFSGPVLFIGNGNANSVTGTAFADILTGAGGADFLTGGGGADIFAYKAPIDGGDTISDFIGGVDKFQFVSAAFGNLTTANFDGVSGVSPDITGKELVIFTGGTYANFEDAQAKAIGGSTTPGFFVFTNAANETQLVFDSNGTTAGGFTTVANLGTTPVSLGTADFVFTGSQAPLTPPPPVNSVVDLTNPGTYPTAVNNFGTGAGGYGFSGPVLFIGNGDANSVTGTAFADILTGGGGADFLTGGSGADIFKYKAPIDGPDTITDFVVGVDKFEFVAANFGNLTTANFDGVSGVSPDITGKELVIFTGGTYANFEDAQAKAIGGSTTPGFFVFTNAANETQLVFDSNGTTAGGFTTVATIGTGAVNLGTADFVFSGTIAPPASPTAPNSIVDLTSAGNTYPTAVNDFSTGVGGYGFSGPLQFTGNASNNTVLGTAFTDTLFGGDGDDCLSGGNGSDSLFGGNGNDTLIGGLGTDTLNGGAGLDVFVFNGTEVGGSDFLTNYNTTDDLIRLDSTGFTGLGTGPLASSFYVYNSTGSTVTQIETTLTSPAIIAVYDGAVSKLYYDSNGSTVGGNSLFATVDANFGISGNSKLVLF
ncbi:MAG TPA: cadherin-like domain-containing protein [Kamptonema sp.]|nr:cadherin-like domain-containing protein [Kamptonema sp.]